MLQKTVYERFTEYFPTFANEATAWFPNGRNSVRVRLLSKRDLVFTYNDISDWSLETVDSFVKRMKGER